MFGHTFYHSLVRKYVTLFGTLFNDIVITRPDTEHNVIHTTQVPLAYGPREKTLARAVADPSLNRMPAIQLPRMSFEMMNMTYAGERKLNTLGKKYKQDSTDPNLLKYQYNPVPYDINFELSIMVKNADDGTRIIEQILPFFTPEWTTTVHLIPEMDIVLDIPIVLNSVNVTDDYEGNYETRRAIIWTLGFTLKGYLFGPVRKNNVIKFATTDFFNALVDANTPIATANTYPGLTANGQPTSNAELTVPLDSIESTDNYGYIVTVNP